MGPVDICLAVTARAAAVRAPDLAAVKATVDPARRARTAATEVILTRILVVWFGAIRLSADEVEMMG